MPFNFRLLQKAGLGGITLAIAGFAIPAQANSVSISSAKSEHVAERAEHPMPVVDLAETFADTLSTEPEFVLLSALELSFAEPHEQRNWPELTAQQLTPVKSGMVY